MNEYTSSPIEMFLHHSLDFGKLKFTEFFKNPAKRKLKAFDKLMFSCKSKVSPGQGKLIKNVK